MESPLGSLPSVSTVKPITTGRPTIPAGRTIPIASSGYVSVSADTCVQPVVASASSWKEWYLCASSASMRSVGAYASLRGPMHASITTSAPGDVGAELLDERNRPLVHRDEVVPCVSEEHSPVGVRAPDGRRKHERYAAVAGELEERHVVAPERPTAVVGVDERERGELREVDAVLEDEHRLETGIGQLHAVASSVSIAGAYIPVRAAEFIFARW